MRVDSGKYDERSATFQKHTTRQRLTLSSPESALCRSILLSGDAAWNLFVFPLEFELCLSVACFVMLQRWAKKRNAAATEKEHWRCLLTLLCRPRLEGIEPRGDKSYQEGISTRGTSSKGTEVFASWMSCRFFRNALDNPLPKIKKTGCLPKLLFSSS